LKKVYSPSGEKEMIEIEVKSGSPVAAVVPEHWVDEYGDFLYGYALLRVRNPKVAENLLQKTFVAGLETQNKIQGRLSERGRLIGILRQQIIEHFQTMHRQKPVDPLYVQNNPLDEFFSDEGKWIELPAAWPSKSEVRSHKPFVRALYSCLTEMPDHLAQVLVLRELEGLATKKICAIMGISKTGIRIMLYRARLHLRRCLGKKCFGEIKKEIPFKEAKQISENYG
jgi:RNA polymerase sigma-70 factor (TIGR02943 family)